MKFKVEFKENNHTIKTNFGQIYKVESSNEGYEEGYEEGYDVGYNKGHLIGKQEGYDDGHKAGLEEGYSKGHSDGVNEGYNRGYELGKTEGYDEGYAEGLVAGKTEGYNEGYQIGYSEGYTKGKTDGYNDGYSKGYDAGVAAGYQDGCDQGRLDEVSAYWYDVQHNPDGTERTYYAPYLFSFNTFPAERFNPPNPILCTVKANTSVGIPVSSGNCMFRNYTKVEQHNNSITEINVDITVTSGASYFFDYCYYLKKVKSVTVDETQTFSSWFRECRNLEEIIFIGEIGQEIDLSYSPLLNVASMKSIISCLVNGGFKVKFHADAWARLEADSAAPNGDTWKNYVKNVIGCTT